jgi:hypothetical protein
MPSIFHKGHRLKYTILPTARQKTMGLKIHQNGDVAVRAPAFIRPMQLRQFVGKRAEWILDKQIYFADLAKRFPPKEFKNGETFPALGRNYRLKIEHRPGLARPICKLIDRRLHMLVNGHVGEELQNDIRRSLKDWYANLTEKKIRAAIKKYARTLAVAPKSFKVVDQAKRWASCSKTGDIRFNWRLSMMPGSVLEYVVVHELCHMKTHDHSARFWNILKSILPDYDKRREWLRQNGLQFSQYFSVNA